MTHRQAAIFGGVAAVLLVVAIAATVTVVARSNDPAPQEQATTTLITTTASTTEVVATSTTATTTTSTTPSKVIGAHAFIAGDLSSGSVLASRKSTDVWPLASLTKLMTATIALREISLDEQIVIVPVPGGNPSAPGIPVGQTFAMRDVLNVMLVASSNEAAESLAAHIGREKFLADMNAQAREWGMTNTQFVDASGLSPGNHGTAREVLDLAREVYSRTPQVFATTRQGSLTVYASGSGVPYTAYATHQLVRSPGFLGGKTGYTDEARGNLLSLFQVGSRAEALVIMGSDDRFGDTRRLLATLTTNP